MVPTRFPKAWHSVLLNHQVHHTSFVEARKIVVKSPGGFPVESTVMEADGILGSCLRSTIKNPIATIESLEIGKKETVYREVNQALMDLNHR